MKYNNNNNNNNNNILNTIKVIFLAFTLTVGIQYVLAQSWSPPTNNPPAGNTFAPLNVGNIGQIKDGGLTLGFTVSAPAPALTIPTGRVSIGVGDLPTEKLDVLGNIKASGDSIASRFCLPAGLTGGCISAWPTGGGAGAMGANPTASVGLASIPGDDLTFMRSDAAPALSPAITPTWTGRHTFGNGVSVANGVSVSSGRVGIGTINPKAALHVTDIPGSSGDVNGLIRVSRPATGGVNENTKNSALQLYKSSGTSWTGWALVNNNLGNFEINYDSSENTRTNTPLFIEASSSNGGNLNLVNGFVGIGTTDPQMKLQVNNGSIYLDTSDKAIILKAQNGTCLAITAINSGTSAVLNSAPVTCPENQ